MNGEKQMNNFSIIIPFFEKKEALKKTWGELHLQLHPDDQVLVVNDWSPNGVPEFDCLCTKVICPPKHTPHIYRLNTLRNTGLESASWDACIVLDPDCVPNPHFLDNARKMFDPSVLFGGCIDKMQEDGAVKLDPRRRGDKGFWCDLKDDGGVGIYGGCMMFSKSRTKLVDWFSEEYNGAWGMEEHDFASRCYHSGIRLRFSTELQVTHQWHPENRVGYERNREIWTKNRETYRDHLGVFTSYKPAVVVLVVSMLHPQCIDQVMRFIFRHRIPLKVRLVNNGDQSEQQKRELAAWSKRWTVDYIDYKSQKPLSSIQSDTMKDYSEKGYKYLIMMDADNIPTTGSFVTLISEMENREQYYTITRLNKSPNQIRRM